MIRWFKIFFYIIIFSSCSKEETKFRLVSSNETGITFRNTITETVEFNIFNYMYFYNGGGVAVGDVNGDDLPDIYFTGNQVPNKLYLNEGNLRFTDITAIAEVGGFNGWCTGVTMADVNNDGRLDIYVGYLGDYEIFKGKNQLFINEGNDEQGIPRFTDRSMEFGLDLVGFSTQAAFFDYDRDGDLDMYMLNHSLHQNGTFGSPALRERKHPLAGDKLLKNENGHFVDVTEEAGIYSSALGYGLGIVVSDINMDGWPDIYIGNDFHENDYLYINQGNGTFKEELELQINHTSRFTMGVDCGDFNNDGFPDIVAMDMLPEDPLILKASAAEEPFDIYKFKIDFGYNHQFARNTLQLNNHNGTFSEIALLAGVHASDWSWSGLFADFDLDGFKDIFISNGILRRPNDLDYINFMNMDSIQRKMERLNENDLKIINKMPQIKLPNYLFINNQDTTFTNKSVQWGLGEPSYSNGASYADLDNDGDLDIIVNNIEDEAHVYENKIIDKNDKSERTVPHYLRITLKGNDKNINGTGAKIFLYDKGRIQFQESIQTRGFQSAVDNRITFGTGTASEIDSLVVIWNDGTHQSIFNVKTNQSITLHQDNARSNFDYRQLHKAGSTWLQKTNDFNISYTHHENNMVEFNREALIPHMLSKEGPAIAVGDLNNDGRDDVFLGGGKWSKGQVYIQNQDGLFLELSQPLLRQDSVYEDIDAVLFDADGDNDMDLLVVSGGNEFTKESKYRQPRLYKNNGKGMFDTRILLPVFTTGSSVSVYDIDSDGDSDVFIGSRGIPWHYGIKPDSYILMNDGKGNFIDATDDVAPELKRLGFIKDALWADVDGDEDEDLVIAAEWAPIIILYNTKGKLQIKPLTETGLEKTNGWWNTITASDVDGDGDIDLIAGNLGLNSKLKASVNEPVKIYVSDFDKNDSTDQILTHFMHGKEYPFHTRDEMVKQMPYLKKQYLSYHKYAETTVHDMFSKESLEKSEQHVAYTFQSSILENTGNGKFIIKPFPKVVQFSTVNAIEVEDINEDGIPDIILAGNFYPINVQMGRNDASYGVVLTGNGNGSFKAISAKDSGFSVKGEVRAIRKIKIGNKMYFLAVRNNDTINLFELNK